MRASWAVLIALLLAVLLATLVSGRAARPPEAGEEPTCALQAASLAWDFDLRYSDEDYRRYLEQWGARPPGIDLESRDGGRTQVYGRPFLHALVAAPFVRAMPQRGMRVANALLLAAAALLTAWALKRPLWVAAFVFASVTFSYVFLATADVFLVAVTAAGFALVYAGQKEGALPSVYEGERAWSWRVFGRWLAIGVLLAIPGAYRPLYLFLLLPTAVISRRRVGWAGLALGAIGLLAVASFVHSSAGGDPLLAPSLTFEADPGLLFWNAVYFLVGRNIGVLPYFLPVLLSLLAARSDRGRWALGVAVVLAAIGFLVAHPYDFSGTGGGAGNRLFLPLYAALWFLPARPLRSAWAVAVAVLAAPFLLPLWLGPAAPASITEKVKSWLPYEATQRDLPGAWISQGDLRIKPTSPSVWRAPRGSDFRIAGAEAGELVIASPAPLESLEMVFDRNAPTRLQAKGQELRPTMLGADGSVTFEAPLGSGRVHPMWWTGGSYHLYTLGFRLPDAPIKPIAFQLRPVRDLIQKGP